MMNGKRVDEVTAARIRRAARAGRVELAPHDKIEKSRQQVDRILSDIGFATALVTDESRFSDFSLNDEDYAELSLRYGFEVNRSDGIAAIAERLAAQQQ